MQRLARLPVAALVAAALATSVGASPAIPSDGVQNEWEREVEAQLDAVASTALGDGYRLVERIVTGSLSAGNSGSFRLTLNRFTEYAFVAACDRDCSVIDLYTYAPSGDLVGSDELTDDVPVVRGAPDWSGRFEIQATMVSCSVAPCYYGVGVFGRTANSQQWQEQVRVQLDAAGNELRRGGYRLAYEIVTGALGQGGGEYLRVRGDRNTHHVVVGVCDVDCSDLDLLLYDSAGSLIESDVEYDDYPVIEGTPRRDETYYVRAVMAGCSNEPCFYGVGIYGR